MAATAMTIVLAAGLWWVGDRLAAVTPPPAGVAVATLQPPPALDAHPSEADFTTAIASLEEMASVERAALDPEMAGAFDSGLTIVNAAIDQSRTALEAAPDSEVAQESLFQALRNKVAILQDTLALVNEMRKGNQDGAARILSEMNQ
jgi:hypothetical protein